MSTITKVIPTDYTAIKDTIFKNLKVTPVTKTALFTVLTSIKTSYPKLNLNKCLFTSDTNGTHIHIIIHYMNRDIKKVLNISELKNIHPIILQMIDN
jgi:hypothetical protein